MAKTHIDQKDLIDYRNMGAADILIYVPVKCNAVQTKKSTLLSEQLTSENNAEDNTIDAVLKLMPEPVKTAKKWIENNREGQYRQAGSKLAKINGKKCGRVAPEFQDHVLKNAREFVKYSQNMLRDAITNSNTQDRQAGYEAVKQIARESLGVNSKASMEFSMPDKWEEYYDLFDIHLREVPFHETPDFAAMSGAARDAVTKTANNDAFEAYNNMLDGMQANIARTAIRFSEWAKAKPPGQPGTKAYNEYKYPKIGPRSLNTLLFDPIFYLSQTLPPTRKANALFSVVWGILGTTPNEMREHLINTKQIGESDKDWEDAIKQNKLFGITKLGVKGHWARLFDDKTGRGFKELYLNKHEAVQAYKAGGAKYVKGDTQIERIAAHKEIYAKLVRLNTILEEIPRVKVDR